MLLGGVSVGPRSGGFAGGVSFVPLRDASGGAPGASPGPVSGGVSVAPPGPASAGDPPKRPRSRSSQRPFRLREGAVLFVRIDASGLLWVEPCWTEPCWAGPSTIAFSSIAFAEGAVLPMLLSAASAACTAKVGSEAQAEGAAPMPAAPAHAVVRASAVMAASFVASVSQPISIPAASLAFSFCEFVKSMFPICVLPTTRSLGL